MTQPELLDVVELLADLPVAQLQAGDQGTILEVYDDRTYEVEFANSYGETHAMLALKPAQFVVVWQNATKTWVPLSERIAIASKSRVGIAHHPTHSPTTTLEHPAIAESRR